MSDASTSSNQRRECRHETLRFGSGDYYIFCANSECGARWVCCGTGSDLPDAHLSNQGIGGQLSGQERSAVETTDEVAALRAVIARLEDWQNQESAQWCEMRYQDDVLVNRVIAECEAARRGIAVTYAEGDDPLGKLKRAMPSMDQLEASQRALREFHSRPVKSSSEEPTPKPEPPTQEWIDRSQGLEPEKADEAKSSAEFLERLHTGHPANCPCWDCTRDQLKF